MWHKLYSRRRNTYGHFQWLNNSQKAFHHINKVYDHSGEEVLAENMLDAFGNISVPSVYNKELQFDSECYQAAKK